MDVVREAFESLVEVLRGRSDDATFEARLDDSLVLARAGEGGVAVENLCSNLDELEVPLAKQEHSKLVELASCLGVANSTAEELERLTP